MTDQPSAREIYAAILDLRGRIEALAWDLTAIEGRMDRLAGGENGDGEQHSAVDRRLAAVAKLLAETAERSARVENGFAEIRDGLATTATAMPRMGERISRVEEDVGNLCRLLDQQLRQ